VGIAKSPDGPNVRTTPLIVVAAASRATVTPLITAPALEGRVTMVTELDPIVVYNVPLG